MKKLTVVLLVLLVAMAGVFAQSATETAKETKVEGFDSELIKAAQAEGELIVYGSCEEDYLSAVCENFEKTFGIKTTYQRLSTGEVQAKIEEEKGNPSADVFFGGTTDPYNMLASEGPSFQLRRAAIRKESTRIGSGPELPARQTATGHLSIF